MAAELYALTDVRAAVTAAVPPEYAVALGCAVQAAILDGSIEQLDVFNVMEAALLRGLAQGKAIAHHLEPSYFAAMTQAAQPTYPLDEHLPFYFVSALCLVALLLSTRFRGKRRADAAA